MALAEYTLPAVLTRSAEANPDNIALTDLGKEPLNYAGLKNKVDSVSNFLRDEGIIPGDKVAILGENCVNWAIAYFAVTSIGAIGVPIMTEFKKQEVNHILRHSESKAVFISSKHFEKIENFSTEWLKTRILLEDFSIIPSDTRDAFLKSIANEGFKELTKIKFAAMKIVGLADDKPKEDDLALVIYTSGTTGHSKGVMLTHKNIVFDAFATIDLVDISESDNLLSILPLFHTIESTLGLVTPLMIGASVTYLNKPPTASVMLPALKLVKPTIMISVPLVIEKIFRLRVLPEINKKSLVKNLYKVPFLRKKINKAAGKKLLKTFGGRLDMFCIGGAAIPGDVELFLKESKFPYAVGYGLTETSPLVTGAGPDKTKSGAAGAPLEGIEIKIENPDPETHEGEVLIKGPNVMKGYYRDEEKTSEVFTEDGWFRSGDLGVIDDHGYLFIRGRSKNVIIGSNGKNIYPEEIESIIAEQMFVAEAIVMNHEGVLTARVHLNYDEIDETYSIQKMDEPEMRKLIAKLLNDIQENVNSRVNTFSRLKKIIEQPEPFEKTPTQKIKRYLYI